MAATRRVGTTSSKTRAQLLDITLRIMVEEGYAAVTSRRVATRAGVKAPLIHYYFPTVDDLFIAALHHRSDRILERLTAAIESDDPLRAIWEFVNDKAGAALTLEFLALANHRKAIGVEIAAVSERFRAIEIEAMRRVLAEHDVDMKSYPPEGLLFLMTAVPTLVGLETQLGMSLGHRQALALIERQLGTVERQDKSRVASRGRTGRRA